ncbi:DNA polymerase V [Citrobacter farmeri]|uniref:DNA polymerase V n=1 Tax=Citrobacter farmeri TaxID=67824 RepID=UPI0023AED6B1|nr:DNA polymerase V [Citrobacter farmeri]
MPRRNDIESAFRSAVVIEPSGRRTVKTADFVMELKKVNWNFSLRDANAWIETSVSTFKDISPAEGEERLFMLYNPNGGL